MIVRDVMTSGVELIEPSATLAQAAKLMRDNDVGALPVAENDRLVGMVTDRDIVVRAIAIGSDVKATSVDQIMSPEVLYCFEDQPVDEVCANMGEKQIRRLPVVNRDKQLVGILSLGDVAKTDSSTTAAEALEKISHPAP